jgi:uncharacterized alkaline shock family protein YloU
MAENKQYLSRDLEKGTLLINEDVLDTIIINAVKEVDGVAGLASRPALDIIELIGKKNIGKALKTTVSQDDEVSVTCNINIYYGHDVFAVAKNAQEAIECALVSAANVVVSMVNVNVCGIIRK